MREHRPALEIWQKGFTDHRIRDNQDYRLHRIYVHMNPVKAGLCKRPEDYPYSSARGEFELDELPQRLKPQG
jgi:putative transposase